MIFYVLTAVFILLGVNGVGGTQRNLAIASENTVRYGKIMTFIRKKFMRKPMANVELERREPFWVVTILPAGVELQEDRGL